MIGHTECSLQDAIRSRNAEMGRNYPQNAATHFRFCGFASRLNEPSSSSRANIVYNHRRLLLKLDIQPRSHLVVEVCIQRGMCTVTNPLQHGTPPPPGVMPRSLLE